MAKKRSAKQLSNIEKYAIQGMAEHGKTAEEMSAEIGQPVGLITEYMLSIKTSKDKIKKNKEKAAEPKPPTAKDLMINRTGAGKKGITIMTPAASGRDESARFSAESRYDQTILHKIVQDAKNG